MARSKRKARTGNDMRGRAARMLAGMVIKGWERDDGEFYGRCQFPFFVHPSAHQGLHDYAMGHPFRWHVTAYCICRAEDGTRYVDEASGTASQAALAGDLVELRRELMREASNGVNPNHIVDQVFEFRLAR